MKKVLTITVIFGVLVILIIPAFYLTVVRKQPAQQPTPTTQIQLQPTPDTRAPNDTPTDREDCESRGGEWAIFGFDAQVEECNIPTTDAGKICNDGSECQGNCFADLTDEQETIVLSGETLQTSGKCSARTLDFYGCHAWVERGEVIILCSD